MKNQPSTEKVILGRYEPVDFIDLEIAGVPAKVDTGAYRSALHARHMTVSEDGKTLSFELLGGHPLFTEHARKVTTNSFSQVEIENSFGHSELRYEVKFKVKVGGKTCTVGFTLANRGQKDFPILLGRTLLNRRFMVDTSHANIKRLVLKRARALKEHEEEV